MKKSTLKNIEKEINNNNPKKINQFVIDQEIFNFDPSAYPLLTLLKSNPSTIKEAVNSKFTWFEDKIVENFLQIFVTKFNLADDLREKGVEHFVSIEKAFWYGEVVPLFNIKDELSVRKTRGIIKFLKDNERVIKLEKNFSVKDFNTFLMKGFTYGSNVKVLFTDENSFKYLIEKILKSANCEYEIKAIGFPKQYPEELDKAYKIWGVTDENLPGLVSIEKVVKQIVTPYGTVNIVKSRVLSKYAIMCLLDLESLHYMYLNSRDTFIKTHIELAEFMDLDISDEELLKRRSKLQHEHCYLTECGLRFTQSSKHLAAELI